MKKIKTQKGITLVALIITIIVLLILAVVAIRAVQESGIIEYANDATIAHKEGNIKEKIILAKTSAFMAGLGKINEQNLNELLKKQFGENNYELISVGRNNYIIILEEVEYKLNANGEVEILNNKGNEIEYAGDLSKNGKYDGLTKETAFRIACIEDLVKWTDNYTNYLNSYIQLETTLDFENPASYNNYLAITNDINGNGKEEALIQELTTGNGFKPITNFDGRFDGKNNEISNLYENTTGNAGLFANTTKTATAEIVNLGITGELIGKNNVGAIVGAGSPIIKNCYSNCIIKGDCSGGLIGHTAANSKTYIYDSYNLGSVEGSSYAGGIVGAKHGDASKIEMYNCYNLGVIKAEQVGGGLIGRGHCGFKIINSFNTGTVIGKNVGGFIGYIYCSNPAISNSFNIGIIESTENTKNAALINYGTIFGTRDFDTAYYLNDISSEYGGISRSKEDMQSSAFLITLNNYVTTFNNSSTDIKLKEWKLENGKYPTF